MDVAARAAGVSLARLPGQPVEASVILDDGATLDTVGEGLTNELSRPDEHGVAWTDPSHLRRGTASPLVPEGTKRSRPPVAVAVRNLRWDVAHGVDHDLLARLGASGEAVVDRL